MATLSIAGDLLRALFTKPCGKSQVSKQGNDLADRNNKRDWTIRRGMPKCARENACHFPRRAYGVSPRDYQTMGPRKLVTSDEGLRYSPASCESMGISAGVGSAFQIKLMLGPNSKLSRWVCASPSWVNSANASGFFDRNILLVNLQIGNINGCGDLLRDKCTKPFEKSRVSRQGNDLADRNNHLDWTIRSVYPKCAMIAYGSAFRDRKLMGLRKSSASNEGLRYDPASCESMGTQPCLFQLRICCKHFFHRVKHQQTITLSKDSILSFSKTLTSPLSHYSKRELKENRVSQYETKT